MTHTKENKHTHTLQGSNQRCELCQMHQISEELKRIKHQKKVMEALEHSRWSLKHTDFQQQTPQSLCV